MLNGDIGSEEEGHAEVQGHRHPLYLLQLLQRAEGLADTSGSLSVLHSRQVIHASVSRARRSLVSCFTPQSTSFAWLLECRRASPVAQMVKNLPAIQETWVRSLGWEDPLEKGTTTHSSILAWRIPWTEEPGGLLSMGLQRVGHN